MSGLRLTRREMIISGAAAIAAGTMLPRTAHALDAVPANRLVVGGSWEGLVGVGGGIPNRTTQSGSTIAPFSGSASTINSAIAGCPADQFVQLGAGTFNLSSTITIARSRVTLRGAVNSNGAPATVLNFTGGSVRLIGFEANGWDLSNSGQYTNVDVSGGVARGSTTITLASTPSSLSVGQMMFISSPASATVTPSPGNWSDLFGSKPFTQIVRVTGKTGNDVSFTPPINADYLGSGLQVHWRGLNDSVKLSGIENLSLTRSGASGHFVSFIGADECWAKNVKTFGVPASTYHFFPYAAYRCEIRHCDISHMDNLTNSTYCINPAQSSQLLVEDNYFHDCPNVMPMFGLSGSAFAYNYINNLPYSPSNWLSQIVFFHGSHSHYNLFEGNWCAASYNDSGSGSRNNLWFRNRMRGWDAAGPKTSNTECLSTESRHDNIVMAGCVLGEPGYHSNYNGGQFDSSAIYALDSTSSGSTLRLGNYNTVNGLVPPVEALGSAVLVTSYLHAAKPAWFGSLPWPWCEPLNFAQSNTATNLPAGYRAVNGVDPTPTQGTASMPPTNVTLQ